MRELQTGLWWWEAVHPDWAEDEEANGDWGPEVSSYAVDDGRRLLLIDRGNGIEIVDSWLPKEVTREQVVAGLRPLLELPVEVVLPTHGAPTDRAALERALA